MKFYLSILLIIFYCSLRLNATTNTNNEKTRLKPKPGNVVIVLRDDHSNNIPFYDGNETWTNSQEQTNGDTDDGTKPNRGRGGSGAGLGEFGRGGAGSDNSADVSPFQISAYPNPTRDWLYMTFPSSNSGLEHQIGIYSMSGQKIMDLHTNDWLLPIDMSQVVAGTYLVRVQNAQGLWTTKIAVIR